MLSQIGRMTSQEASVAELVDAPDSKSGSSDRVRVRFSPEAPSKHSVIFKKAYKPNHINAFLFIQESRKSS